MSDDWQHMEGWKRTERGVYRRTDSRGTVIQVGSHEWNAQADVGEGMRNVGVERTATIARIFVDDVLSKGKIPLPPEVTPGPFFEQVTEKIRRAGLSSSVLVRKCQLKRAEGVLIGTGEDFDVAIIVNEWGMKGGQRSYQVFDGARSREPVSNHDDERWKYPQKGEIALNEAVGTAVKVMVERMLNDVDGEVTVREDEEDDDFDDEEEGAVED